MNEVKAVRIEGRTPAAAGEFRIDNDEQGRAARLVFACPCGCDSIGAINLKPHGAQPSWDWDGDREKPTCSPSIRFSVSRDDMDHWHGYLTAGVFRSC